MRAVQLRTEVRILSVTGFRLLPSSNSVDAGGSVFSLVVELAIYLHVVSSLQKAGLVGIVTGLSARRSEVRIPAGITELIFSNCADRSKPAI